MRYKTFGRNTGLRVAETGAGHRQLRHRLGSWRRAGGSQKRCSICIWRPAATSSTPPTAISSASQEAMLGDLIAAERDNLVVATKYSLPTDANPGISRTGNGRKNMIRSVEESLKRLKTDHIDLYWAHMTDGATPIEEIVRAFDDLVRAGKIHYPEAYPTSRPGALRVPPPLPELRGWSPIAGIQVEYSLVERTAGAN